MFEEVNKRQPPATQEEIYSWVREYVQAKFQLTEVDFSQTFASVDFYGKIAREFCGLLLQWLKLEVRLVLIWEYSEIRSFCNQLFELRSKDHAKAVVAPPRQRAHDVKNEVAIIGVACSLPNQIESISEYWQLLSSGQETRSLNPRWDHQQYPSNCEYGHFLTQLDQSLQQCKLPLAGVLHLAGLDRQQAFTELSWMDFEEVLAAKVARSCNLHQLTNNLDFFVMFFSITIFFGSNRQTTYVIANGYLNSLHAYRLTEHLPSTVINWGPWGEVGMMMQNENLAQHTRLLKVDSGIIRLLQLLEHQAPATLVVEPTYLDVMLKLVELPWIQSLKTATVTTTDITLSTQLQQVSSTERFKMLYSYVRQIVMQLLCGTKQQTFSENSGFLI